MASTRRGGVASVHSKFPNRQSRLGGLPSVAEGDCTCTVDPAGCTATYPEPKKCNHPSCDGKATAKEYKKGHAKGCAKSASYGKTHGEYYQLQRDLALTGVGCTAAGSARRRCGSTSTSTQAR